MVDFRPKTPEPARPERAEAPSPGQRPGLLWMQACRPEKGKSFQVVTISYNEKKLQLANTNCSSFIL